MLILESFIYIPKYLYIYINEVNQPIYKTLPKTQKYN